MMFRRKVTLYLEKWKKNRHRKPLLIQGAPGVGKTYAVLTFGKERYDNVVYFNFRTNLKLSDLFAGDGTPAYLVPILSVAARQTVTRGNTLIVLDEIERCERVLTALQYFCERAGISCDRNQQLPESRSQTVACR